MPVIQWEKDQTEDAGLVKIDLLGNRSLAVIRDTITAINKRNQYQVENSLSPPQLLESKIEEKNNLQYETLNPISDPLTKATLIAGDTIGVFYIESPGTRLFLKKMKSGDFEHIIIAGSIIRRLPTIMGTNLSAACMAGTFVTYTLKSKRFSRKPLGS